jgi:hypothetical protein
MLKRNVFSELMDGLNADSPTRRIRNPVELELVMFSHVIALVDSKSISASVQD